MARLLTVREAAETARCSEKHMRALIWRGELEAVYIGRLVRIRPETLSAWIQQGGSRQREVDGDRSNSGG